jgi:cobalt-zinc-cadmium efflux system outer membrane protein
MEEKSEILFPFKKLIAVSLIVLSGSMPGYGDEIPDGSKSSTEHENTSEGQNSWQDEDEGGSEEEESSEKEKKTISKENEGVSKEKLTPTEEKKFEKVKESISKANKEDSKENVPLREEENSAKAKESALQPEETSPKEKKISTPKVEAKIVKLEENAFREEGDSKERENGDNQVAQLDLDGLIRFAKENNPIYESSRQKVEIAKADLIQAGLLPNPVLGYSNTFIGGTPTSQAGSMETAPALNMEIDVFGKRGIRQEVAEHGVQAEKLSFADFDRLFRLHFRQVYRQYLLLLEQVKYKEEFYNSYLKLLGASRVRLEKGDISGIEFDRLELERVTYEADYRATELQIVEISQKLRWLLGLPPSNKSLKLKGQLVFVPLDQLKVLPEKPDFLKRPDLGYLVSRYQQADSKASLMRREALPSFNVGGEYRIKGNNAYPGVSVSLSIPIFNRNQGEIARAEAMAKKFRLDASLKEREIQSEVQTRHRVLLMREKTLINYKNLEVLERNKKVAERARFAYLKKAYSILGLVESQRNFINVQKSYYDLVYLYYNAIDEYLTSVSDENGGSDG